MFFKMAVWDFHQNTMKCIHLYINAMDFSVYVSPQLAKDSQL